MSPFPLPSARRRDLLLSSVAATLSTVAAAKDPDGFTLPTTPTTDTIPMVLPRTEFVYEAIADLQPSIQLGASPFGERFMVPIIGGTDPLAGAMHGCPPGRSKLTQAKSPAGTGAGNPAEEGANRPIEPIRTRPARSSVSS